MTRSAPSGGTRPALPSPQRRDDRRLADRRAAAAVAGVAASVLQPRRTFSPAYRWRSAPRGVDLARAAARPSLQAIAYASLRTQIGVEAVSWLGVVPVDPARSPASPIARPRRRDRSRFGVIVAAVVRRSAALGPILTHRRLRHRLEAAGDAAALSCRSSTNARMPGSRDRRRLHGDSPCSSRGGARVWTSLVGALRSSQWLLVASSRSSTGTRRCCMTHARSSARSTPRWPRHRPAPSASALRHRRRPERRRRLADRRDPLLRDPARASARRRLHRPHAGRMPPTATRSWRSPAAAARVSDGAGSAYLPVGSSLPLAIWLWIAPPARPRFSSTCLSPADRLASDGSDFYRLP